MKRPQKSALWKAVGLFALPSLTLLLVMLVLVSALIAVPSTAISVLLGSGMLLTVVSYCVWCTSVLIEHKNSLADAPARDFNFLKIVADNIQAPLLSLMHDLRKMMLHTTSNESYAELHRLFTQGFQLQGNINDALELSRPEGEEIGEVRVVDLHLLASDIGENYAQLLSDKPDLSLSILVDHTLPQTVKADPRRVMHLVGNLLENAIRFSDEGPIVLKISALKSPELESDSVQVEISCSDCGFGIKRSELEMMNSELRGNFDQSGVARIGLGLRAAHNIVTQYQGEIRLSSDEGKGTVATATLRLPIASAARSWDSLPHSFRFFSTSNDIHVALGHAALFHGIRAISMRDPKCQNQTEPLFIDARDLYSGVLGAIEQFEPRNRYVVMLDQNQPRVRQALLNAGFTRFLMMPFASTMLLQCLLEEDAPVAPQKRMSKHSRAAGKQILVVDDTETSRLCVCDHLRNAGYEVTEASDGLEMVSLVRAGNVYDLILSDLTMTYLDGEQAMRQVHEFESMLGRRTPIVAMTAYSAVDSAEALKLSGFSAVLQKPVFLDELDYLIANLCETALEVNNQTQFIDIEDLKERTAGKQKLMAILLDSFISSSQGQLQDLLRTEPVPNRVLQVKALHTLKGLLLEAGAGDCARELNAVEKRVTFASTISQSELMLVKEIVEKVWDEAERLQKTISQSAK